MNVAYNGESFDIKNVHPNQFLIIKSLIGRMYNLIESAELKMEYDKDTKSDLLNQLYEILTDLNSAPISKTAVSKEECLVDKVIEYFAHR